MVWFGDGGWLSKRQEAELEVAELKVKDVEIVIGSDEAGHDKEQAHERNNKCQTFWRQS